MKRFADINAMTETVGPRNLIDDTMIVPLIAQRLSGQHVLNPNWTWRRFILYQLASVSLIIYVCFGTKEILSNTNDIQTVAEASYTYSICGLCLLKYLYFIKERFILRELYIKAKTEIFDVINDDSFEILVDVLRKTKLLVSVLFLVIAMPVTSYVLRALWFYIKGERVTLSKTTSTLLPHSTPFYEFATLLHVIFMVGVGSTYATVDAWLIFMLSLYSKACESVEKILKGVKREEDENEDDYALRLNDRLRKFYLQHTKLVEFLFLLNKLYRWQALVPLLTATILACIPMLSMTKSLDLAFTSNIMPTLVEILTYNYFGEQIKTKSSNIRAALIKFDWLSLRLRDKKSFYIIVCFTNKEFGATTVLGNDLSLITLTSVLKASYQAFTMLQSFEG